MPPTPTARSPAANGSRSTGNGRSARISRRRLAPAPRSSRRAEPTTMSTTRRLPVVATLPRSLYLETTNRCDSKCQTCIRTFQSLEPPADLTLERVRMIAEQFPALDRVVLHGIGEPLLNPQIFDIVFVPQDTCRQRAV